MKKAILTFAGMLALGISATFAQVDTTKVKTPAPQVPTQAPATTTQPTPGTNYTKDMVKIQATEIPDNLRQTLQGSEYKGWESGTLYRTQNNDGFLIETKDGSKTKVQRFDGNGKPVKDQ